MASTEGTTDKRRALNTGTTIATLFDSVRVTSADIAAAAATGTGSDTDTHTRKDLSYKCIAENCGGCSGIVSRWCTIKTGVVTLSVESDVGPNLNSVLFCQPAQKTSALQSEYC